MPRKIISIIVKKERSSHQEKAELHTPMNKKQGIMKLSEIV